MSCWWPTRVAALHTELLLALLTSLMSPAAAQLGQYTLDINSKSSEGIFITYFQVTNYSSGHNLLLNLMHSVILSSFLMPFFW